MAGLRPAIVDVSKTAKLPLPRIAMPSALSRLGRRLFDAPYLLLVLTMLFWSGNLVVGRYVAWYVTA